MLRVGQVVPVKVIEASQPLDTHTLFGQVMGSKYIVQIYFTDIYDGMDSLSYIVPSFLPFVLVYFWNNL